MLFSHGNKNTLLKVYRCHKSSYWLDLSFFIGFMFLIRQWYFEQYSFIANGLFWSFCSLLIATFFMRIRGVSWADLGLCQPATYRRPLIATVFIFVFTIASILIFQMLKEHLGWQLSPDLSAERASSKFGDLNNNWKWFFSIIPFIWMQSMFEELLDRGFLMNWFEKALQVNWFAVPCAVLGQAIIFGFRHSYDLSERSITVGLIGLAMGLGYVLFGRNLWPLIVAHCLLNTMSMIDRI